MPRRSANRLETATGIASDRLTPTVIVPARSRLRLRDLWGSGAVVRVLASRDLKIKYKQSALGPLWLIIQPLGLLLAFTVAFSGVGSVDTNGVPYALFGLVGLVVWSFFQAALLSGAQVLPVNATLVRRTACPRLAFVTSSLASGLPILAVTLVPTFVLLVAMGEASGIELLALPVALAWLVAFVWGTVALAAGIGARFRDIVGMLPFLLQAGLFISPVGFPAHSSHALLDTLLKVNPLTGMLEFWRWCLLANSPLHALSMATAIGFTVVVVIAGWYVFSRLEVTMADYV